MAELPEKAPNKIKEKRIKEKRQTPEQRLAALRYNQMMYGRTQGEQVLAPRTVDYGASYLKHPKFQSLIKAFKNGTAYTFDITSGGRVSSISTDGAQILFGDKILFYSRSLNRYEDNLVLVRAAAVQCQGNEAAVHLIFAVIRSFPELEPGQLTYSRHQFYAGLGTLASSSEDQGPNMPLGSYKHTKVHERVRP
jgi:hypothetical protein